MVWQRTSEEAGGREGKVFHPLLAPASIYPETFQHTLSKQDALFYDGEERNLLCF